MDMAFHFAAGETQDDHPPVAGARKPNFTWTEAPIPESGWASRHPERALTLLFVAPAPGRLFDELMAL